LLSGVFKTALKNENVYTCCLYDIDKKQKHIFLPGLYENMILMDDYSGSGETFVGALECIMNAINNEKNTIKLKKIYLSAIRYSKVAIEKIEQAKSNYNFEVEFIKLNTEYTGYEINQDEQDTFEQLNNDIYIKEEYKRGYAQCKDLYSTVYSTPNNTYGMFWYGGKYSTNLFDRNYGISQNMFFKEVLEKLNSCIKCKNKMDCEIIALIYLKYSNIDILKITQCDTKKYKIAINYAQSQRILKSDFTPDVNFDKFFVKANLDSLYSNEHVKNEIEQKLDSLANT
jgi:hypothetical protein